MPLAIDVPTVEEEHHTTLLNLLNTSLVLHSLASHLPLKTILNLTATSKDIREILYGAPETFRYLNLTGVKRAILPDTLPDNGVLDRGGTSWRNGRMDDSLTPDEFYSGPLRGIFNNLARKSILRCVQTLVLDGISVTADLVSDILLDSRFNVRILSIREVRHMNENNLQKALNYAVRPSRPQGTPRVKGIYLFGPKDSPLDSQAPVVATQKSSVSPTLNQGILSSPGAQIGAAWNEKSQDALNTSLGHATDRWYQPSGNMFNKPLNQGWAGVLQACEGIIAFDAVLCRGPRHDPRNANLAGMTYLEPAIANFALGPSGCAICHDLPEGPARFGQSPPHHLPLLAPPPLHSCSVQAAQKPAPLNGPSFAMPPFLARCGTCLRARYCERCGIWWDETCYPEASTQRNRQEVSANDVNTVQISPDFKTHLGLCTQKCLINEMMLGAGSMGMWG